MRNVARPRFGDAIVSIVCLATVFGALVVIDDRVRDRFSGLFQEAASGDLASRFSGLFDAVFQAARDQSIANAPMLIFTVVGVVLLLFMLRT